MRRATGFQPPQKRWNRPIRLTGKGPDQGAVQVIGIAQVTAHIAVAKVEAEAVEQQGHGVGSRDGVAENSVRDWLVDGAAGTSTDSERTRRIPKRRLAKGARG